ncbi:uncharacterized protein LOC131943501 [Physella acuta]|uniref:uncharacterized protein LOC131943501 n=1 Tax=Physella acuta TaxID=109671 RepID=UPI0027DAB592|nr:uncharacterized protein LOC131943501 [Physella acuta]
MTRILSQSSQLLQLLVLQLLHAFVNSLSTNVGLNCSFYSGMLLDDICYIVFKEKLRWKKAKEWCNSNSMHLARIESDATLRTLGQLITENLKFWLGGHEISDNGMYAWVDNGQPVFLTFMSRDEPNNFDACLVGSRDMIVEDQPCTNENIFLCMFTNSYWVVSSMRIMCHCLYRYTGVSDSYWVVSSMRIMCHCLYGACDDTGNCQGLCQEFWFGPACQYRDILPEVTAVAYMDNNDATCTETITPLIINLGRKYNFSWIRVVLKKSSELRDIKLKLWHNHTQVHCSQQTQTYVNALTVDISCGLQILVIDMLELTSLEGKEICSIYLNKGRNVALMKSSKETDQAVDGLLMNCITTQSGEQVHTWTVHLMKLYYIYSIVVHRSKRPDYEFMKGFNVEGKNSRLATVARFQHVSQVEGQVVELLNPSPENEIVIITLTLTKTDTSFIEICEFEAYGDCAAPFYGLECENLCPDSCVDSMCLLDGTCVRTSTCTYFFSWVPHFM